MAKPRKKKGGKKGRQWAWHVASNNTADANATANNTNQYTVMDAGHDYVEMANTNVNIREMSEFAEMLSGMNVEDNVIASHAIQFQLKMFPVSDKTQSRSETKKRMFKWKKHLGEIEEELEWLKNGSEKMTTKFISKMFGRIMDQESADAFAASGWSLSPQAVASAMIRHRLKDIERTQAQIQFHLSLLERHQEKMLAKKFGRGDKDNNGSGGFGGAGIPI